jgi:dolichol-phosphate mannosyltransferase
MPGAGAQRATVVIATYDERANVEQLLPALLALPERVQVLVVDDASPDGTGEAVEAVAAAHPGRVELLRRAGKLGYGSAFVEGFARALEGGADIVVSMDADFSHAPGSVPELIRALREADVAIGSRYIDGIRILNWSLARLLLSVAANRYVNTLLRLGSSDCTSGFRAYRAEVLRRIGFASAGSNGYAFLVELLDRVVRAGFRVVEVPIVYEDRQHGESKMNRRVMFEAAWKPWALLLGRARGRRAGRGAEGPGSGTGAHGLEPAARRRETS